MASIPFIAASGSSLCVVAIGAAANVAATLNNNKPLESRIWQKSGGFIGNSSGRTVTIDPPSTSTTPKSSGGVPIGGETSEPAPPTPLGLFPRCRPTKLPGPPKPFEGSI